MSLIEEQHFIYNAAYRHRDMRQMFSLTFNAVYSKISKLFPMVFTLMGQQKYIHNLLNGRLFSFVQENLSVADTAIVWTAVFWLPSGCND